MSISGTEHNRLLDEIERLTRELGETNEALAACQSQASGEINYLRGLLWRYGWHDEDCPYMTDEFPCNCGLGAAIDAATVADSAFDLRWRCKCGELNLQADPQCVVCRKDRPDWPPMRLRS